MGDDLVGQLLWAFISSARDIAPVEQSVREGCVGGLWLLPTEMHSPGETAELINRLQAVAPTPLLVGVDAEAGLGLVMGGATYLPTAMALGATGDPRLAYEAAAVTAAEARACGINAVAAPVLDVNINPANPIINARAFGSDPALVARLGVAFVEGLQNGPPATGGVRAIGKHFPGHGDTADDSHLQLAVVDRSRARLEAVELPPFRAAIDAGAAMLMTAHVAYPALDPAPGTPATLSRPILADLLRDELGFQGAVVTDCMNMHAVADNYAVGDAAVRSVLAGCDLVLTHRWEASHEALTAAARDGRLPHGRLREAAARVRKVKEDIFDPDLARPRPIDPGEARALVGTAAHDAVAERIAAASVTIVDGAVPEPPARPLFMATRMARRFGPSVEAQLRDALTAIGWAGADVLMLDPAPDDMQAQRALQRAREAGWAALLHFNQVQSFDPNAVLAGEELVSLVARIEGAGVPVSVASMGSPYILPGFRGATARLCGYSTCGASLRATLRVLAGVAAAVGRLPTLLPEGSA